MGTHAARAGRRRLIGALLLLSFAVAVLARMPEIVLKGRFWAEEGKVFFADAWAMPPLQALFTSYGGYLNLVANAATLAAHLLVPLRDAPYVTIAVGLAFQLLPPALLLAARDAWLRPLPVRVASVLLLLLVPGTEEIWLQTLHCQFELTLCAAILLALEVPAGATGAGVAARLAVLALTPLCGPGGIVLAPLFLVRAVLDRSRARLLQGTVFAAACAVQLSLFTHSFAGRAYRIDPSSLVYVVAIRHVVEPFLGLKAAYRAEHAIRHALAQHRVPVWAVLLPAAVFVPFALLVLRSRRAVAARWLLLSAGCTGFAAYFGAIGGTAILFGAQSGERYVFVPQALLALSLLGFAATAAPGAARLGAWVAVLWLVVVGAGTYVATVKGIRNGPAWRDEVRAWQRDPSHVLRLWPDGWTVRLPPPRAG